MAESQEFERFGRYLLLHRIAIGGMAEIFLALPSDSPDRKKLLVIKRIRDDLCSDETFVEMFIDEARLVSRLAHPNIIKLYEFGQVAGRYFIALEHVWGESLRTMTLLCTKKKMRFPLGAALYIGAEAAGALHNAHHQIDSKGELSPVIHRDVTLGNVVVSFSGDIKVLDFGIAKAKGRLAHTQAGQIKGTLSYLAPEQLRGQEMGPHTDIYQLGVLLYQTLVGRLPVHADNEGMMMANIVAGQIIRPSEVVSGFPMRIENVLLKAMAREPEDRFSSAGELQSELQDLIKGTPYAKGKERLAHMIRNIAGDRLAKQETFLQNLLAGLQVDREGADAMKWVGADDAPLTMAVELSSILEENDLDDFEEAATIVMPELPEGALALGEASLPLADANFSDTEIAITDELNPLVEATARAISAPTMEPQATTTPAIATAPLEQLNAEEFEDELPTAAVNRGGLRSLQVDDNIRAERPSQVQAEPVPTQRPGGSSPRIATSAPATLPAMPVAPSLPAGALKASRAATNTSIAQDVADPLDRPPSASLAMDFHTQTLEMQEERQDPNQRQDGKRKSQLYDQQGMAAEDFDAILGIHRSAKPDDEKDGQDPGLDLGYDAMLGQPRRMEHVEPQATPPPPPDILAAPEGESAAAQLPDNGEPGGLQLHMLDENGQLQVAAGLNPDGSEAPANPDAEMEEIAKAVGAYDLDNRGHGNILLILAMLGGIMVGLGALSFIFMPELPAELMKKLGGGKTEQLVMPPRMIEDPPADPGAGTGSTAPTPGTGTPSKPATTPTQPTQVADASSAVADAAVAAATPGSDGNQPGRPPLPPPPPGMEATEVAKPIGQLSVRSTHRLNITHAGKSGEGNLDVDITKSQGLIVIRSSRPVMQVSIEYSADDLGMVLRVDGEPPVELSAGGIRMGATPQTVGPASRFSLQLRNKKMPAPIGLMIKYDPK